MGFDALPARTSYVRGMWVGSEIFRIVFRNDAGWDGGKRFRFSLFVGGELACTIEYSLTLTLSVNFVEAKCLG